MEAEDVTDPSPIPIVHRRIYVTADTASCSRSIHAMASCQYTILPILSGGKAEGAGAQHGAVTMNHKVHTTTQGLVHTRCAVAPPSFD